MSLLTRICRVVPPELWALLLIAIPIALAAIGRIDTINTAPATLMGPNDPDPWLRLTLVRDWLEGGDWFNHDVARSNAPEGGITTPWTRPLDVVIATLVKLQPDNADLSIKLLRAATALPVIWIILLMLGLFKAGRQLHPQPMTYLVMAAMVGSMPVLWSYFGKGNADHHAPLAALWAWIIAYAIQPAPRPRDCWIQGLLMALMLWISPEALMLIGAIYAWQLLRWLHDGQRILPLVHLTSATAYGTWLALVIERAPGTWLIPIYDSISIVHAVALTLCAAVVRIFALLPDTYTRKRVYRLLGAKLGGTAFLLIMAVLYPKFFHGPMADASTFILSDFLPRINEAKSILTKPAFTLAGLVILPFTAAWVYARMLRAQAPIIARPLALQLFYLLMLTFLLTLVQVRWYYYLFPVTAIMLAPVIGALFTPDDTWPNRMAQHRPLWQQVFLRIAIVAFIIVTPTGLLVLNKQFTPPKNPRIGACESAARTAIHSGALTRALGSDSLIIYAPTNLGAEILFFTPYRIIASNYHREGESIRYVWDAMRIDNEQALHDYLVRRNIDALLICPDNGATKKSILMDWWEGKKPPAWLTPITIDQAQAQHPPRIFKRTTK